MTFPTGNTTERGYGIEHQKLRKWWTPKVERGEVNCWRCGRLIKPGEPWDLGHDDIDRTITRGPEHRGENRATATHKAKRRQRQRWRSRVW